MEKRPSPLDAEVAEAEAARRAGKWLLTCWLFKFGCSRSLPIYIASKSVLYTLYSVKKCHVPALRAFRGERGGHDGERARDLGRRARRHSAARAERGHGERSRLQLLFNES